MTVIHMSAKGEIIVPRGIRNKCGLHPLTTFAVIQSKDGDLILRPVKSKPKLSLIDHLRKFKGLEIPKLKAPARPGL